MPCLLCLDAGEVAHGKSRPFRLKLLFTPNRRVAPSTARHATSSEVPLGASEGRASERVVSSPREDMASWTFTTKDERVKRERGAFPALEGREGEPDLWR